MPVPIARVCEAWLEWGLSTASEDYYLTYLSRKRHGHFALINKKKQKSHINWVTIFIWLF